MTNRAKTDAQKPARFFTLSRQNAWLLWCSQLVNIACLSLEISSWMLAILALCLCWQAFLTSSKYNNKVNASVSPFLLTIFALCGCVAIAITANNHGVLLSMIHLLSFAYMLKSFEIKQRKDFYQLLLLGLFLLASALIFKQDLAFSLVIFIALILNLIVLQQVFSPSRTILASAKMILILLIQSAMLAIVLFIVFPRLSPFWQVPSSKSAQTGLSDKVSPGDIANLALSSDLAFRVDFKNNEIPQYSSLYWRAMTLETYDGRTWSRTKKNEKPSTSERPFVPKTVGEGISYDVIVEPSYQSWLFGLAVANSNNTKLKLLDDYTIQSRNILSQISHYQLTSYLQSPLDLTLSDASKQRNLAITKNSNPRLEKLASALKQKYSNIADRSNAVLAMFREQHFFYTLEAPLLINNSLDQFFFDTKAGFCVHYASAYTYLMRAAGIPARVVTGYLGGEYNDVNDPENTTQIKGKGGHLSIYQYDAHAWSEIWIEGKGWQRVDPTAAVDPQRVESGWSSALLAQQSSLNNDLVGLYQFKNIAWLNKIRLELDALDYQWTRWVLGYSSQQQYDLLKRWFGKSIPWKTAALIVFTLVSLVVLFTLFNRLNLNRFKRKKLAPWQKLYQQALVKFKHNGLVKPADMTPTKFTQKVADKSPELSKEFTEFTKTFECLMYKELSISQRSAFLCRLQKQYDLLNESL